jgi:fatty-acyl-CoA synthase
LVGAGIRPGDKIAAMLPLTPSSYQAMLAGMTAATVAPLNYFLSADALIDLVRQVGARYLLAPPEAADDPGFASKVDAVVKAVPELRLITFGGPTRAGSIDLDRAAAESSRWPDLPHDSERPIVLMLTGGTTGKPKVVPHSEAMYMALFEAGAHAQGMLDGDRILSPLPLFHTSGALNVGLIPLMAGASIVVPSAKGFRDPAVVACYWDLVERFGITVGGGVPTALAGIANQGAPKRPTALRHLLSGGAPLPQAIAAAIKANVGADVVNGWGMTETCGFSMLNSLTDPRPDTVGRPYDCIEAEIRLAGIDGELGQQAASGQIGELVVRGAIVIKRYLDEYPRAFTADGWLRTGDLARTEPDGSFVITGRAKDIIIRGGHNIDPAMIEEAAYRHPAVELAAAVGKPDNYAGELPVLFVQLRKGDSTSADQILAFVRPLIAERAAVPKAVEIVDPMPLSGPGKISKLMLRKATAQRVFQSEVDRIAAEHGTKVDVTDDAHHGLVAVLSGLEQGQAEIRRKIADALSRYAMPFRWNDGDDA